jgi:CarD family transcriptional regulator
MTPIEDKLFGINRFTPDEDDVSTVAELMGLPEPDEVPDEAIIASVENESDLVAVLTQQNNDQFATASVVKKPGLPRRTQEVPAGQEFPFKIGDRAVYPAQGVAEVVDIRQMTIHEKLQNFFVLQILGTNRKVMIPFDNAASAGVRPMISPEQIEEIWALMGEQMTDFGGKPWHRRYKDFIDKLRTGSIFDVVEVVRDLNLLSRTKTLSFGESSLLEKAKSLLVSEIALVCHQEEAEVRKELARLLN